MPSSGGAAGDGDMMSRVWKRTKQSFCSLRTTFGAELFQLFPHPQVTACLYLSITLMESGHVHTCFELYTARGLLVPLWQASDQASFSG